MPGHKWLSNLLASEILQSYTLGPKSTKSPRYQAERAIRYHSHFWWILFLLLLLTSSRTLNTFTEVMDSWKWGGMFTHFKKCCYLTKVLATRHGFAFLYNQQRYNCYRQPCPSFQKYQAALQLSQKHWCNTKKMKAFPVPGECTSVLMLYSNRNTFIKSTAANHIFNAALIRSNKDAVSGTGLLLLDRVCNTFYL